MKISRKGRHLIWELALLISGSTFVQPRLGHASETDASLARLSLQASWTKRSTSYQVKNLFPFKLPDDFPANARFRGLVGTISTTASAAAGKPLQAVTVFNLSESFTGQCPTAGEEVDGYDEVAARYGGQTLGAWIVKQSTPGTETAQLSLELPVGIPLKLKPGDCLYAIFDGTDFADQPYTQPYTMKMDLEMLYDTEPFPYPTYHIDGLDAEFTVAPNVWAAPVLNAYSVIPVSSSGPVKPGELLDVAGNSAPVSGPGLGDAPITAGAWSEREIVAVYRDGSCQKAFPNHGPTKFFWNDPSGLKDAPNPSSIFWPSSQRLLDVTLSAEGIGSVMTQANAVDTLPVSLEEGDCIVLAFVPNTDSPDVKGTLLNIEDQIRILTTP